MTLNQIAGLLANLVGKILGTGGVNEDIRVW